MSPQLWALAVLLALIILTLLYSLCKVAAPTDEERRMEDIETYLAFRGILYAVRSPSESEIGLWIVTARANEYAIRNVVGETRLEALENLMRVLLLAEVRA